LGLEELFQSAMDTEALREEIELTFPFVEMPPGNELVFHKGGCPQCADLCKDLEERRGEEITSDFVRMLHQELYNLSAQSMRWILPHYLLFCLTPEAQYNQMETEYLIYNLGPVLKNQKETSQRLSLLNKNQINTLIHFLEWCLLQENWKDLFSEYIAKAINFLRSITPRELYKSKGQTNKHNPV
jgi:hypothetical protein